jgi:CrcB protein
MHPISKTLLVGAGGFVGANLRYWLGTWIQGKAGTFPWSTMLINITGSFALGLFMGLFLASAWRDGWRLLIAIGVLGGYTTYSSYAYEAARLLEERSYLAAVGYVSGNALLSVVGAIVGLALARAIGGQAG